eukprot:TRINITY_DN21602_c0_g1_i1.p1 TRINITY_DN21602_c0_g1~~TRINITY_DN21602_c0_g1_i1.p1  ORF type:complete len:121 (-),score=23.57 TRINITY_DN21602_c0_g1_i1:42-404(-)
MCLRLGIGEDAGRYGDRTPLILVSDGALAVRSALNGDVDYKYIGPALQPREVYNIKIQQTQQNDPNTYNFDVSFNGQFLGTVPNMIAMKFNDVKLYAGDSFYPAANAQMWNLVVKSKECD